MYVCILFISKSLELLPLSISVQIFQDNHPLMTVYTLNCSDGCDSCLTGAQHT